MHILTLNLNGYGITHGAWISRRALVMRAIQDAQAAVVLLQAVRQEPGLEDGKDQATQLAEQMPGYRHTLFVPATEASEGAAEGSAILSKVPLTDTSILKLSHGQQKEDQHRRVLLRAQIASPFGPLHLFNAHYSWVYTQAADNLKEVLPYIKTFSGPALMAGDFSQPPESNLMTKVAEAGWTDLWAYLRPGEHGYTFTSDTPSKRIDYVWANERMKPHVKSIRMAAATPDTHGARASDHLGIVVSLG